jgi:hypothetical protein
MSDSNKRFEAKFPMPDFAEWDASRNTYTHAHALALFTAAQLEHYKGLWEGWQAAEAQSNPVAEIVASPTGSGEKLMLWANGIPPIGTNLYTAPQPQDEPIAWLLCRRSKGIVDVVEMTMQASRVAEWYTDDFNYVQPLCVPAPQPKATVIAAPKSEAA